MTSVSIASLPAVPDLVDGILAEHPPGEWRRAVEASFSSGADPVVSFSDWLVTRGWLEPSEVALASLPLVAARNVGIAHQLGAYAALGLVRVGVPLAARGAFDDDPSLPPALEALASRNP